MNLKDASYKSHLNYFSILRPIKNDVRFEYVPWKDVLFCFISIARVDFGHKTEKF